MPNRKQLHAAETKQAILTAAADLFGRHGYDTVTMRQIAHAAGCSHTAIYLYFKDKEDLLLKLALPKLESLHDALAAQYAPPEQPPQSHLALQQLHSVALTLVRFAWDHPNLYPVLFMTRAERVDLPEPGSELTEIRNRMFNQLQSFIQRHGLPAESALNAARTVFIYLHGFITMYTAGPRTPAEWERVQPILGDGLAFLWRGLMKDKKEEHS